MSASLRVRFGVVAAGLSLLVAELRGNRQNRLHRPGQTDRSTVQQADPSTAPGGERAIGEVNQNRTNYRAAQAAAGGQSRAVDHFLANCLLGKTRRS